MSLNVSDDVERLFQCFKCGASPPESALRERKANKSRLNQASSSHDVSTSSHNSSSTSEGQRHQIKKNSEFGMEGFSSSAVKADYFKHGNPISPIVFYGSPQCMPPKRHSRLLRLLREIHIDLAKENKTDLRKEIWATFPRQDEAMKFANEHAHAHIFSYQDHLNGQRRFLVSTYEEFWQRYKNMDSKYRHHYEVIQEGLPCHLYFDLEFCKRINADKDGSQMVDLLVSVNLEVLLDKYSIHGRREWVIELDSSTEDKFSRHVIIRIPKAAFKDNSHVGAFVAEVCSRVLDARDKDGTYDTLLVFKDSGTTESSPHLFVDTAVYSRNRCFRLALSSKAGKNSVLLPTRRFLTKDMSEEEIFMKSLICNMDVDCQKLLVCKIDVDCVKTLQFDTELNHKYGKHSAVAQGFPFPVCASGVSRTYFMGKSPFPLLDMFIESVASIGNISGKIRCWYWFSEYGLMVYSMSRNRFCERIGRQHKSNHVMYVVDLARGVYYQKCHDPDCRGYRSPNRPIPAVPMQMEVGGGLTNDDQNLEFQCVEDDEMVADDFKEDVWWDEALTIADRVEYTVLGKHEEMRSAN